MKIVESYGIILLNTLRLPFNTRLKMFNFDSNVKNKYYNLYLSLRDEILRGKLKAGEKLPSKRALAADAGVSVVTVQLAYEQLLIEGYIRSVERSGYFVEELNGAAFNRGRGSAKKSYAEAVKPVPKFKVDLVNGATPAALFPFSTWAKLIRNVLSDCGEHLLERVPADGDAALKDEIAAYLYRARGIDVNSKNIVVGAGAEHLYGVIVNLLGRDKLFAVENPGYGKISYTYLRNGACVLPVRVTGSGISVDEIKLSCADVAHVSPSHQFPTGAVMPASARSELIGWAADGDKYIIEDDYDSEFRLTGKPLQSAFSMCPERVIYLNTFSKSLAPSMRMGYMILPEPLYEKYLRMFSDSANLVSLFEQKALAAFLKGGYFERHIARLRNHCRGIREEISEIFSSFGERCEVTDNGSGLHITVKFYNAGSDGEIKSRAAEKGVNIKCLSDYLTEPLDGFGKCAVINYSGLTRADTDYLKNLEF